jgi:competence protein ComEC
VVQTRNHLLVFDAGPRFGSGFNTGEAVVAPYLLAQGRGRIDTLVVSHSDNDHMGGVASLLAALPVQRILSSEPQKIVGADAQPCAAGQQWQWDGVQFAMLNPVESIETSTQTTNQIATQAKPHTRRLKRNNRSCVLRVQAGEQSVLLSGDIEEVAEREMVERLGESLRSDVLVVPHHGSKTSSSVAFVEAVSPRIALFPVGYRNRYGFPKAEVVQRYRDRHIQVFDTASHGALEIRLGEVGDLPQVRRYRQTAARYWHDQPLVDSTNKGATVVPRASDRSVTLLQ